MPISRAKTYTEEFKASAVKLVIGSKNPITQTTRELGVKVSTLHTIMNP